MTEPLKEVKLVLIVIRSLCVARSRSAERASNELARQARGDDGFGGVERDVGHRSLFSEAGHAVYHDTSHGQRGFVDTREDVVEPLSLADVRQAGVSKEIRDARVEEAHARAGREECGRDRAVARREERLLFCAVGRLCHRGRRSKDTKHQSVSTSSNHLHVLVVLARTLCTARAANDERTKLVTTTWT